MARILITGFCSVPAPSRSGVQLGYIIRALHRQHQVDVLGLRRDDQGHVERQGGTRYLRVPLPEGELASNIEVFRRALRRQLDGGDYDVVHFRDGWSGVTALESQASKGFATVFDVARSPMAEPTLTDRATATEIRRAEQSCVRRADLILAPTEPARRFLAGLTDEEKIHVVPPGVNVDRFDWEDLNPDRAPIILYMGSLESGRGVRVLLNSMVDVVMSSKAVLVLAGPASKSFSETLEKATRDMHLQDRVRLLGEVPHELVPAIISRSTICVAPGATELASNPTALFPTKILEYMACRRAVVAPDRGTVTMLLRDGKEGLLFSPGNPKDLADKLLLLLMDRKLRTDLAQRGYEMVRSNCTAGGTRRSLRRAYGWLSEQEGFRERLGQEARSDSRLAPITELGLKLSVRNRSRSDATDEVVDGGFAENVPDHLAENVFEPLLLPGELVDLPERSVAEDPCDVTEVEVAVLPQPLEEVAEDPDDTEDRIVATVVGYAQRSLALEVAPKQSDDAGDESWLALLEVLKGDDLDTGERDLDGQIAGTVITVPMDNSSVAGELPAKPHKPDAVGPFEIGVFDSSATPVSSVLVSPLEEPSRADKSTSRMPRLESPGNTPGLRTSAANIVSPPRGSSGPGSED